MSFEDTLRAALAAGTREHYLDAALYDHEYRRRRDDVRFYRDYAAHVRGPILELGCGTGRLLVPLVRDGHSVVGVDLSTEMLARCRERISKLAPDARARAELHAADFRALELGRRFPIIFCPFNAFMHLYTRDDVERFFSSVRAHLAPGGRLIFDIMNPDLRWLSRDPRRRWGRTRFLHPTTGRELIYTTTLAWDSALQIAFMNIYYAPTDGRGREKIVRLAHRHFFPLELEALVHYNGFRLLRRDGDFDGARFEPDSEYQVCACEAVTAERSPDLRRARGR